MSCCIIEPFTNTWFPNFWKECCCLLIDFLPMDIDFVDPLHKIREVQVKIPKEIQEIKNKLGGSFNSPDYAEDIYEYLQVTEHLYEMIQINICQIPSNVGIQLKETFWLNNSRLCGWPRSNKLESYEFGNSQFIFDVGKFKY